MKEKDQYQLFELIEQRRFNQTNGSLCYVFLVVTYIVFLICFQMELYFAAAGNALIFFIMYAGHVMLSEKHKKLTKDIEWLIA
jgi:hypothetical protein